MNSRQRHLFVAVILVVGLVLAGCSSTQGSGTAKTETRQVNGFTEVEVRGLGELTVDQTGSESLSIEADDNILPLLESKVANGQLSLGPKAGSQIQTSRPIRYRLTVRDLKALRLSGSTTANAQHLNTARLETGISGSGKANLAGQATEQNVSISGSGEYLADQLMGKTAEISVSGDAQAKVNVTDSLDVSITGSGAVRYLNSPRVTQHISGSGSIQHA